jgi:hypothetical protein
MLLLSMLDVSVACVPLATHKCLAAEDWSLAAEEMAGDVVD